MLSRIFLAVAGMSANAGLLVLAILAAVNALCGLLPKSLTRQDIRGWWRCA